MTNKKTSIDVLREKLENLVKSKEHLQYSYNICKTLKDENAELGDEYFVQYEALTARYGRTIDILVNSVLRAVDVVEYFEAGSIIDTINRAEKRKFVETAMELRAMKDLRNEIVHNYDADEYEETFDDVLEFTPALFSVIDKVVLYCERYTNEEKD